MTVRMRHTRGQTGSRRSHHALVTPRLSKCADCGAESKEHDEMHTCGDERCQPKCAECKEAEENCTCPAPVAQM